MRHSTLLIQSFLKVVLANFICLGTAYSLPAQTPVNSELNTHDRQLIVDWTSVAAARSTKVGEGVERKWLSATLAIELLQFRSSDDRSAARAHLMGLPTVTSASLNSPVHLRVAPNDPFFERTNNFDRAGFTEAWNLTAGGTTLDGTEIVVAILDEGFDVEHDDLRENLWVNPDEIPNNGRDDDGNGVVDDVHGANFVTRNGTFRVESHGTLVMGQIGARGDNGRGVAGTNWDTKMMLCAFRDVSHVIEGYEYILDQRRRWNDSGGTEGAFVVATNASFGVEGGTCSEFPAWGAMYDALGREGVLTAAAVANRSWNVDLRGDMPVDCTSEYLIGVANLDTEDRLFRSSGYGRESVDLAAPGEGGYSTQTGNRYGSFGSTSAAAPLVTGAIALLYATPCAGLMERTRQDPAGTALRLRDILLETTQPNLSVAREVATGGVLDVAAAQRVLAQDCGTEVQGGLRIDRATPNPTASGYVLLQTNALVFGASGTVTIYDMAGRRVRTVRPERTRGNPVTLGVDLGGLAGGMYWLRVRERGRAATVKVVIVE